MVKLEGYRTTFEMHSLEKKEIPKEIKSQVHHKIIRPCLTCGFNEKKQKPYQGIRNEFPKKTPSEHKKRQEKKFNNSR